jgi:hypothetical protein
VSNQNLWECPKCGREFSKEGQWHSCSTYTIHNHFKGKLDYLRQTFDYLIAKLRESVPLRIDSVKSAINLGATSHFGMIYVQKNSIKLEFLLDKKINDNRILRCKKVADNTFFYVIKLINKEDIDDKLLSWLVEAYSLKK